LVHGTCVAVGEVGVLIQGPSGAGKSGLALQMIALGATLVADDQVYLDRVGDTVHARAPQALQGLIEARGIGLLSLPHKAHVALHHCIDLSQDPGGRLPKTRVVEHFGLSFPLIAGLNVPNLAASMMILGKGARLDGER